MPTSVGPNTFGEENLVFGYDLGDVKNSYKGEPVVNIWSVQTGANVNTRSGWDMPYAYNGTISNSVYSNGTWNGNRIWEVLHTSGSSGYGGYESWRLCVDQPTAGNGTYGTTRRVAIKICVLEGSITDMGLHSGGGNGGHSAGDWTPIPESQVPRDCPVKTGWYQFLADGSWNSNSVGHCVGLGFISYNRVRILTTEPMYYPADHLIPFAGDTRSVSGSLRDLTNNSTIDSTNVSFDSNAQMTFDGTDDIIQISAASWNILQTFTLEAVFRPTGTAGSGYHVMFQKEGGYSGGAVYGLRAENQGNGNIFAMICYDNQAANVKTLSSGVPIVNGQTYHVVSTFDSLYNWKIYVNGELKSSSTLTALPYQNSSAIFIGRGDSRTMNGYLPVSKIYNRALTASEVKSNFNAIKDRFNI